MRAAILDSGVGNLGNIARYVERELGAQAKVTGSLEELVSQDLVVLPGVGNFAALAARVGELREALLEALSRGAHVLAVCLGMQLLYEESEEAGGRGLGLLRGRVVRLPGGQGLRVPRIGWSPLTIKARVEPWDGLDGLDFYYAHSYYASSIEHVVGVSHHGALEVPSLVVFGRVVATQFHPERSGLSGRAFARALLEYVRR